MQVELTDVPHICPEEAQTSAVEVGATLVVD